MSRAEMSETEGGRKKTLGPGEFGERSRDRRNQGNVKSWKPRRLFKEVGGNGHLLAIKFSLRQNQLQLS